MVLKATISGSCFWSNRRFPLLWFIDFDLYVSFELTFISKLMLAIHFPSIPMNMRFATPFQRVVFLISYAFPVTLAYLFGCVESMLSQISIRPFIFPLIHMNMKFPTPFQRVVFFISYAFPSTLAYLFGCVESMCSQISFCPFSFH